MEINNDFEIEDIVFLKHDVEQKPRMINEIIITKFNVLYGLISGTEISNHYSYELSKEKKIY